MLKGYLLKRGGGGSFYEAYLGYKKSKANRSVTCFAVDFHVLRFDIGGGQMILSLA
jgi:hypothetical protein